MMNIKYLNRTALIKKVEKINDDYWNHTWEGRWKYMYLVTKELKLINPDTIIELGAYKINLTSISDNMDLNKEFIDVNNLNNKTYIQDAIILPWDIKDKYYDVFVGLQVFEHLGDKQSDVFKEVERISKYAILSFPYKWNTPNDIIHYNIDDKKIKEWTNNIKPEKIIYINYPKVRRRVICIYKF